MKDRLLKVVVVLRSSRSVDILHREARKAFDGVMGVTGLDRVVTTEVTTYRKWDVPPEEIDLEGPSV